MKQARARCVVWLSPMADFKGQPNLPIDTAYTEVLVGYLHIDNGITVRQLWNGVNCTFLCINGI